jgi:uncharacterized protein YhaN
MVIKEIHIDGFGIFSNFSLALPGNGIHIILGNNEAGKSTMLKFIRYTLFGKSSNRIESLNGGSHGGRIKALMSKGGEAVFAREGKNKTTLSYDAGTASWADLLGNASEKLFFGIYAFTLDDLVNFQVIDDSGMKDKIYSLGMGLGRKSVADLQKPVMETVDAIYKGRGKKLVIPNLTDEIARLHQQIHLVQQSMDTYRRLVSEIETIEAEITLGGADLKQLRLQYNALDAHLKCYESFVAINHINQQLSELPPLQDLPVDGVQQLENAIESKRNLKIQIRELQEGTPDERGIAELEQILQEEQINRQLLDEKAKIDYLRLNLAGYRQMINEKAGESQRLRELDDQIQTTIAGNINSAWTENDVVAFTDEAVHLSRKEEFMQALATATEEKRSWDAQEKVLMSQPGSRNTTGIATILAVVALVLSIPFFYYQLPWIGIVFIVIAVFLLSARKFFKPEDKLSPVKERITQLEQQQKEILTNYRNYLKNDLRLSPELSFPALTKIIQNIEKVKTLINERNRIRAKIQEERLPAIYEYEGKVKAMWAMLGNQLPGASVEMMVHAILEQYDAVFEHYQQLLMMNNELAIKLTSKQQLEARLHECRDTVQKILDSIKAASPDEFFSRYRHNNLVKELMQKKNNAIEKIETVAGINKADEVMAFLSLHDKQTLLTRLEELSSEISHSDKLHASQLQKKGERIAEKDRLAGEAELSQLLTSLEIRRQKLREAYKEWLSGKLALHVLSEVKSDYEKNRQPAVIKAAGNYFRSITQMRYQGLRASLEASEVSVYDEREASRSIDQLSRGTREQLLVCLRLGLIEEYEQQAEPLPVIVDEILVNFDKERARETAKILQQFAQNRQILIFTCHPSTIDLFDKEQVHVVELSSGKVN